MDRIDLISLNYFKSWFMIDIISSIPISNFMLLVDNANNDNQLKFLKLIKLPKYIRMINILNKLSESTISDYIVDMLDYIGV